MSGCLSADRRDWEGFHIQENYMVSRIDLGVFPGSLNIILCPNHILMATNLGSMHEYH